MKLYYFIITVIILPMFFISCDSSLLQQGNADNSTSGENNTHLITGIISAQNYSTDSDNDWLTISDPNILKDESLVQIQFKEPGEDVYAVYTEWPIPPQNFYIHEYTIYKSSMTITSDELQQYKYIDVPELTQSIIDSGAVMVYVGWSDSKWWSLPANYSIDSLM